LVLVVAPIAAEAAPTEILQIGSRKKQKADRMIGLFA
jgi:hypothetical protein